MMFEPGERPMDVEIQRKRIQHVLQAGNQMMFVAEAADGALVGILGALGGANRRSRATVHIFVGVRQAYRGRGIASRLFEVLEVWAHAWGAHRLELTVMAHNQRALQLYERLGFVIEGRLCDALRVDGQYVDELSMAKIFDEGS